MSVGDGVELLKALAAVLGASGWPVAAVLIAKMFRKEIAEAIGRLKKGKILGQEVELDEKLDEAESTANAAVSEAVITQNLARGNLASGVAGGSDAVAENTAAIERDKYTKEILEEASRSPKAALIELAGTIEREFRKVVAAHGHAHLGRMPLRQAVKAPQLRESLPANVVSSVENFLDVRNKIVHGKTATKDDAIRAIDIGLTVLRAIQAVPRERNEIHHPGVPVYSDSQCKLPFEGVKGVILKTTSPGGAEVSYRIFPTTSDNYKQGEVMSWEWNLKRVWERAWYRDPESGEVKTAWTNSSEFAGRNLEDL